MIFLAIVNCIMGLERIPLTHWTKSRRKQTVRAMSESTSSLVKAQGAFFASLCLYFAASAVFARFCRDFLSEGKSAGKISMETLK